MKRMKFDKKTTEKVVTLVKRHMDPLLKLKSGERKLRKYIRDVGDETVDAILDLARADELGRLPSREEIPVLIEKINKIRSAPVKIEKKPVLDGNEIMKLLNLERGPEVGEAKELLFKIQDEYASKNKKLTKTEAKKELLKNFKSK